MSRWFRFYDSVLDDPKVQRLPKDVFWGWVNLLCLMSKAEASGEGKLPSTPDIAFALRISDREADSLVMALMTAGLLDDTPDGLRPHNWEKRQFVDRTNAERQRRFRERKKAEKTVTRYAPVTPVTPTVTVTAEETDTDTDTEKKQNSPSRARPKPSVSEIEFEEFYRVYPRHVGKAEARRAYEKAIRSGAKHPDILKAARRYASATAGKDPQYIKHPATWLNARAWEDDAPAGRVVPLNATAPRVWTEEELEAEARQMGAM